MLRSFGKKTFLAVLVILVGLVLLGLLLNRPEGRVEALVPSVRHSAAGVVVVTVLITNGMPRRMNIVDDVNGKPDFALQWYGDPGLWLSDLARRQQIFIKPGTNLLSLSGGGGNHLTIHLRPGECLTNMVVLTNPPPRFRLMMSVRDLNKNDGWLVARAVLSRISFGLLNPLLGKGQGEGALHEPTTPWIEWHREKNQARLACPQVLIFSFCFDITRISVIRIFLSTALHMS